MSNNCGVQTILDGSDFAPQMMQHDRIVEQEDNAKNETVHSDHGGEGQHLTTTPTLSSSKNKVNKRKRSKTIKKFNHSKHWICKKCDKVFTKSTLLRTHRKIHHAPKQKPKLFDDQATYTLDADRNLYICNTCCAEHENKTDADNHITAHNEIFKCLFCDEISPTAYDYGIHMVVHSDNNIYNCYYCSYSTTVRKSLETHINSFHFKKFYHSCEKCGRGFNNSTIFKEHENEHLGIRPFICVVCHRDFPYSKYLRAHQIRHHHVRVGGVIRKYLCDLCGKGFTYKDKLNLHYRMHTGEKPFSCSFCVKSFTKKNYLVLHERVHTGEKPYSCQYCGRCFNQKAPLNVHLRTHTGEKPFACKICDVHFTSKGTLNSHLTNCTGSSN